MFIDPSAAVPNEIVHAVKVAANWEPAARGKPEPIHLLTQWREARHAGHACVRQYWTRQWTMIDPLVEPLQFRLEETNRTKAVVHQVV